MNRYRDLAPEFSSHDGALEPALLMLTLGIVHSAAEITILGLYGLHLSAVDLAILCVIYPLGATVVGVVLSGALRIWRRTRRGLNHAGATTHTAWLLRVALCVYTLIGAAIVRKTLGWPPAVVWLALLLPPAGLLLAVATRRPARVGRVLAGIAAFAFLLAASTLLAIEWNSLPKGTWARLAAVLLSPTCAAMLVALLVSRRSRRPTVFRAHRCLAGALGVLVVAVALWMVILPRPIRWHLRTQPIEIRPRSAGATEKEGPPTILLIVLDTVTAGHMDLFGYDRETMPGLTHFAHVDCSVAAKMMATAPSSLPTHASMFTGLYPGAHGAHKPFLADTEPPRYAYPIRPDVTMMAELLAAAGYRTVGISANFGPLSSFGIDRGFAEFDVGPSDAYLAIDRSWLSGGILGTTIRTFILEHLPEPLAWRARLFGRHEPGYKRAAEISDLALHAIENDRSENLFLFLNYFDAHAPYLPVKECDELFAPRPPELTWRGFPDDAYKHYLRGGPPIGAEEIDYLRGQYDAELLYLDRELGRLLEGLRQSERFEESLIFVVSDHGEAFMEHGWLRHSQALYEPQISVPLLVKIPASASSPPEDVSDFQFVDIFPTVCRYLGVQPPNPMDGSAWAEERDFALSELFCHFCQPMFRGEEAIDPRREEAQAVRIDRWKVIRSTRGETEVYDLITDPAESRNVLGRHPEVERRALEILDARTLHVSTASPDDAETPELLRRLQSIGYLAPGR